MQYYKERCQQLESENKLLRDKLDEEVESVKVHHYFVLLCVEIILYFVYKRLELK